MPRAFTGRDLDCQLPFAFSVVLAAEKKKHIRSKNILPWTWTGLDLERRLLAVLCPAQTRMLF